MELGGAGLVYKGQDLPHILHTSQELMAVEVAGRLGVAGVLGAAFVVVVVVVNVGITALVTAKHPMSNFLNLLIFFKDLLVFILLVLIGAIFLQKYIWTQTGVKGLTTFLCSSMNASIFFRSERSGCTCLLQGLQVVDWVD